MSNRWLLVETFGGRPAPTLIAVGSTPKKMITLAAVLGRGHHLELVQAAVARATTAAQSVELRASEPARQAIALPLSTFAGQVHGAFVWVGAANEAPPERDPAGAWHFNLTTDTIGGSTELLDLYGVAPEHRQTERATAEAFERLILNADASAAMAKIVRSQPGEEHQVCAWLAWSRYRVVIPLRDKTLPSVFAALDVCFRRMAGVPTYVLTDNEKTVTVEHVAGIPVRNPSMVAWSMHYATTVHTCQPADPASKGGTEASVKISKADLVPTDANLRDEYDTFAELEAACEAFCEKVNTRTHRVTRRLPVEMLAEERHHLHPVPVHPYTVAFGTSRVVPPNTPMIAFEAGQYSVPERLVGQSVWVRVHGRGADEQIIVVHVGDHGPVEVARHARATPGSPQVDDEHFSDPPAGALNREPKPKNAADSEFLALGEGARLWLVEAAAAGSTKMRVKMSEALALAKLFGATEVDWALGHAAVHGRFAEADLASILDHHATTKGAGERHRAGEDHSLTQGTAAWARLGTVPIDAQPPRAQPPGQLGAVGSDAVGDDAGGVIA